MNENNNVAMSPEEKRKQLTSTIGTVVMYIFIVLCIFAVSLVLFSDRSDDGAINIFGYQIRLVVSPSMEQCDETDVSEYDIKDIPTNSLVFVELIPEDEKERIEWIDSLDDGDVLTFRYLYARQITITHRIREMKEIKDVPGGYMIYLEGDNKNSDQDILKQVIDTSQEREYATNYIIGKVVGVSYVLGLIITFLRQPLGLILTVILPCLIIIILEILKILGVVNEDKKIKADAEKQIQEERIADLERMIAELKNAAIGASAAPEAQSPAPVSPPPDAAEPPPIAEAQPAEATPQEISQEKE